MNVNDTPKAFSMIADFDGDISELYKEPAPTNVPILPVRNYVLFPGAVSPIMIGRDSSLALIKRAEKTGGIIGVVCQTNPNIDNPNLRDLYPVGVYARVVKVLQLSEHNHSVVLQGLGRLSLKSITQLTPYLTGEVESFTEQMPLAKDQEFDIAIKFLRKETVN